MKEPILYRIFRPIIKIIIKFFFNPKIINNNFIPNTGRIILAGNHTNIFDCLLLISCTNRTIHFLAKEELSNGLKKYLFNNMGLIYVNRKIHDKNALKKAIELLNEEKVIGIFPEGTISKTNDLLPFKIGAVKMSNVTNSSIIPFSISGNYKFRSKNLRIYFDQPIKIKNDLTEENDNLRNIIIKNRGDK